MDFGFSAGVGFWNALKAATVVSCGYRQVGFSDLARSSEFFLYLKVTYQDGKTEQVNTVEILGVNAARKCALLRRFCPCSFADFERHFEENKKFAEAA